MCMGNFGQHGHEMSQHVHGLGAYQWVLLLVHLRNYNYSFSKLCVIE